jgi:hypothetical protein
MDLIRGKFEHTTMRKSWVLLANNSLLEILVLMGIFRGSPTFKGQAVFGLSAAGRRDLQVVPKRL